MRPLLLGWLLAGLFVATAQARVWNITADGTGDAPTIMAAFFQATPGDEILVQPGTYYENIEFAFKDGITLRSASGPAFTILDGSLLDSATVTVRDGPTRACRIEGFTIRGGRGNDRGGLSQGGGVFVLDASPEIVGNIVLDNIASGFGGGIYLNTSSDLIAQIEPLVQGNRIENNSAGRNGGGMVCWGARAEVCDNVFVGNEAAFDGGGIFLFQAGQGSFTLRGNQFWENIAQDHGGALECGQQGQADPLLVEFNLFVRNEAYGNDLPSDNGTGGAISLRGWAGTIRNNTFAKNVGSGGNGCTGGDILVASGTRMVLIENNLFYASSGCALTCRDGFAEGATVRNNLFWQNVPQAFPPGCLFAAEEGSLYGDPLLCGPESDNYTVSVDSPALSASPMIGVWLSPGCGPGVPVELTTWGRIKARFKN